MLRGDLMVKREKLLFLLLAAVLMAGTSQADLETVVGAGAGGFIIAVDSQGDSGYNSGGDEHSKESQLSGV